MSAKQLPALAAGLLVLVIGCQSASAPGDLAEPRNPLLLLAVDGLEWSVLLPLLEAGELPTLRHWIQAGDAGLLESIRPTKSPVIWTTVATGKPPEEHGILDFVRRESSGSPTLYTSRDRKTAALWGMASALNVPTAVVGWWMTWPVEPVDGVMVSQTNTLPGEGQGGGAWKGSLHEGTSDQVWPPERTEEILQILTQAESTFDDTVRSVFGFVPRELPSLEERLWKATRWALRADAVYLDIAHRLLAEGRFELVMVYLGGADVVGHRFWRYYQPELFDHPPGAPEIDRFGAFVEDYYRYLDRALGKLTDALDGWNILLVSDHGMVPHHTDGTFELPEALGRLTSAHHLEAPPGVLIATGPGFLSSPSSPALAAGSRDALRPVGTVLDVAPTVLTLLGLPDAMDMRGHVLDRILRSDLSSLPRTQITSYDGLVPHQGRRTLAGNAEEDERLEQLRALGYLGND